MIVAQLTGGLGNQLFQYAMAKTLSVENNCALKLDLSSFADYKRREYELHPFAITQDFASVKEVDWLNAQDKKLSNKLKQLLFSQQPVVHEEKDISFDPFYLTIKDPAYLIGYWQSEQYFKKQEALIRKEFVVTIEPSVENAALLKNIRSVEAVSLHIRRGDYISLKSANEYHGVCSPEYYAAAIKAVAARCSHPVFFIFSDDIAWAKANMNISFEHVFVDINNDKTGYEDMRLMYNCKHHIIANSSFSWWGAWLNNDPGKIVLAPQQWFADPEKNKWSATIIPDSWIRL